jgi:hypothetical protein
MMEARGGVGDLVVHAVRELQKVRDAEGKRRTTHREGKPHPIYILHQVVGENVHELPELSLPLVRLVLRTIESQLRVVVVVNLGGEEAVDVVAAECEPKPTQDDKLLSMAPNTDLEGVGVGAFWKVRHAIGALVARCLGTLGGVVGIVLEVDDAMLESRRVLLVVIESGEDLLLELWGR